MRALIEAAGRHPVLVGAIWIALCWALALVAGDRLVAAGFAW